MGDARVVLSGLAQAVEPRPRDGAQRVADAIGSPLHVVHAYPGAPTSMPLRGISADLGESIERQASADARKAFDRELVDRRIPRTRRHLVAGHPVDVVPGENVVHPIVVPAGIKQDLALIAILATDERSLQFVQVIAADVFAEFHDIGNLGWHTAAAVHFEGDRSALGCGKQCLV